MIKLQNDNVLPNVYGGNKNNFGYKLNDKLYLVKTNKLKRNYGKESALTCHRQSVISEYIGSKIANIFIETQNVELAVNEDDELCVMCEDFTKQNDSLIQLTRESSRDTLDEKNIVNDYTNYVSPILANRLPINLREIFKDTYITLSVLDFILANPDRHLGNIAYILNKETGICRLAPAYDFGASLGSSIRIDADFDINNAYKFADREIVWELTTPMQIFNKCKINRQTVLNLSLPDIWYSKADDMPIVSVLNYLDSILDELREEHVAANERLELIKNIIKTRVDVLLRGVMRYRKNSK